MPLYGFLRSLIRPENLYEYCIKVRHSISPTSDDTSLKTQNTKCDVSINKEVYELIRKIPVKENGYILGFGGFKTVGAIS